jgi:hypothetical protein
LDRLRKRHDLSKLLQDLEGIDFSNCSINLGYYPWKGLFILKGLSIWSLILKMVQQQF